MSDAGRLDEKLLALLDESLERIGPERTARRAALLSAKSAEMYWVDNDLTESTRLVDEAIEIAREVDAPGQLWPPRCSGRSSSPLDRMPRASGSRLADEMLELGEAHGRPRGRPARPRLPALAVPRARRHRGCRSRACRSTPGWPTSCAMPEHSWQTIALRGDARPARRRHRRSGASLAERGEAGGRASRAAGRGAVLRHPDDPDPQPAGTRRGAASGRPRRSPSSSRRSRPGAAGVITLAARSGDVELARRELERFAGDDFSAIPEGRQLVRRDEPAGRGHRADRRRRRAPARLRRAAPVRGPGHRRGQRRRVQRARSTGCSGCSRRRWAGSTTPSGTSSNALEIATRMGDRPGMALCAARLRRAAARPRRGQRPRARPGDALDGARARLVRWAARWIVDRALARPPRRPGAHRRRRHHLDRRAWSRRWRTSGPTCARTPRPTGRSRSCSATSRTRPSSPRGSATSDWLRVLREHNAIFREQISRHEGYEVKSQGDGFMLAFPDPCEALECAIEVQRAFAERERTARGSRSAFGSGSTRAR